MRIGIVLHPFHEKNPAGLGRSLFLLTKALLECDTSHTYIMYVQKMPHDNPFAKYKHARVVEIGDGALWLDRGLRRAPRADVYLFGTPVLPLFFRPERSIVVAHDFAYHVFPSRVLRVRLIEWFLRWYHGYSLRRATHIVAVSVATKRDIITRYRIDSKKITPIHWGYVDMVSMTESAVAVPARFALFVGVIKERKNVMNIVKGFLSNHARYSDTSLVLAGKDSGTYADEIRKYIHAHGASHVVHFVGHVSDNQLAFLYKRAQALLFPSTVEGFGFPVLEAFSFGLPVITSTTTSLPEIAGDAALLVDPYNEMAIGRAIAKVLENKSLQDELRRKGYTRAKTFIWEKTALAYQELFDSIASRL